MSLLQRFARTVRPTSINPATTLRAARNPSKAMDPYFFSGPSHGSSLHNVGLGRRLYSSYAQTKSSNMSLLYGLIGVNTGVFIYGLYVKTQAQQGFPQPLVDFLQNMTINLDGVVREGRWWTTITCVFTHLDIMHLLGNMLSVYYMGSMVAWTPGVTPLKLATIIFGSGLTGSLGYLALRYNKTHSASGVQRDYNRGLGFSGAVMGVGAVGAFLYPKAQMLIWGIVPVPMWALMAGYGLWDGYFLQNDESRVGHAGHLGGLAFGALYYFARIRRLPLYR